MRHSWRDAAHLAGILKLAIYSKIPALMAGLTIYNNIPALTAGMTNKIHSRLSRIFQVNPIKDKLGNLLRTINIQHGNSERIRR